MPTKIPTVNPSLKRAVGSEAQNARDEATALDETSQSECSIIML
jgi:hypothetical protein